MAVVKKAHGLSILRTLLEISEIILYGLRTLASQFSDKHKDYTVSVEIYLLQVITFYLLENTTLTSGFYLGV